MTSELVLGRERSGAVGISNSLHNREPRSRVWIWNRMVPLFPYQAAK